MEDSKKKVKKISILLNIVGPIIFIIFIFLLKFSDLVLYLSWPSVNKLDVFGVWFVVILPVYFIINLIIHIISAKKEEKMVMFIKQFGFGFVMYIVLVCITLVVAFSPYNDYLYAYSSPTGDTTYILEEITTKGNERFFIKKKSNLIFSDQICEAEYTKIEHAKYEISWIDNQTFNIKLIPSSSEKDKTELYYTFQSLQQIETISKDEYEKQKYIKTEEFFYK